MKLSKSIGLAVAAMLCSWSGIETCRAQELYQVVVSAVGATTNQAGALKFQHLGNREIIKHCADEQGVTNRSDLSLVYDRGADALQVVQGTNHTIVCTPLSFSGGVSVGNSSGTRVERLAFVYSETNTVADGSLQASEFLGFGSSNQVTSFHLVGRLQFAVPGDGTNSAAAVYQGVIIAGPVCVHAGHDGHGPGFKAGKSNQNKSRNQSERDSSDND